LVAGLQVGPNSEVVLRSSRGRGIRINSYRRRFLKEGRHFFCWGRFFVHFLVLRVSLGPKSGS
jgi:hypothetical protein